jgi:hypothetical protein
VAADGLSMGAFFLLGILGLLEKPAPGEALSPAQPGADEAEEAAGDDGAEIGRGDFERRVNLHEREAHDAMHVAMQRCNVGNLL